MYNELARNLALIWGVIVLLYPVVYWKTASTASRAKKEQLYIFMKDNRLVPMNEYLFLAIMLFVVLILSVKFYKKPNDVWWVLVVGLSLAIFLVVVQYYRGIIKLLKNKRNN